MKHKKLTTLAGIAALWIPTVSATAGSFCPADCGDGDGDVGIVDFLALLSEWGQVGLACDIDGSGVGITDFLALLAAWGPCPAPVWCGSGSGTCCAANGTPGCVDVACCGTVCETDPYCCDAEWDAMCADLAQTLCACDTGPCTPGAGSCCVANGTPGCEDEACCGAVCAIDPYCCDGEWDGMCAELAQTTCDCSAGSCGPGHGACCIANGTPGCEDVTCCEAVCTVDPFCCDVEWDGMCANQAITLCGCP